MKSTVANSCSFFGTQKGEFTLDLYSISGIAGGNNMETDTPSPMTDNDDQDSITGYDKPAAYAEVLKKPNLLLNILCCGLKL